MADTKPPKGDQAAFKERVEKLVAATQEVVDKKPDAAAHYKDAVNCKACHTDFKADPPKP
jgi:cytochrome c556